MGNEAPPATPEGTPLPESVKAQMLATEHWSLLASRSTTQSEVLTRIGILLTVTSAALVSVALVGQATRFDSSFIMFAVIVLCVLLFIGVLTQVRVTNVGMEDLMYVLAMNRLRAAYSELAPGIEAYFMASMFDDRKGVEQTYYFLGRRNFSQLAGSSLVVVAIVNSLLAGLLTATIVFAAGGAIVLGVALGVVVGSAYLVLSIFLAARTFYAFWRHYVPLHPHPLSASDDRNSSH
jgi:hypothetical protein